MNNPVLVPYMRPIRKKNDLKEQFLVTLDTLNKRLVKEFVYMIFANEQPVGQMSFQKNSELLYNNQPGTAWVGLMIGEPSAQRMGVGTAAMEYLEEQIFIEGSKRIELGVFEFNKPALNLYNKRGYKEIGRNKAFTYWQGRMWDNICMEKYL